MSPVLQEIQTERDYQKSRDDLRGFDTSNTLNDYVAYITGYAGRAAEKMPRNEKEVVGTKRQMLVKTAALCVAAIENLDLQ